MIVFKTKFIIEKVLPERPKVGKWSEIKEGSLVKLQTVLGDRGWNGIKPAMILVEITDPDGNIMGFEISQSFLSRFEKYFKIKGED